MEEANDVLELVQYAIESKQNESIPEITNLIDMVKSDYEGIKNTLEEKRNKIVEIDQHSESCSKPGYNTTVCDLLELEALNGTDRIDRKWKVCEFTYFDHLSEVSDEFISELRKTSDTLCPYKDTIQKCSDDNCLLKAISDILKEKKTILDKIETLKKSINSQLIDTLSKLEICVLDGTSSFIAEHTNISEIYCDCTAAAPKN